MYIKFFINIHVFHNLSGSNPSTSTTGEDPSHENEDANGLTRRIICIKHENDSNIEHNQVNSSSEIQWKVVNENNLIPIKEQLVQNDHFELQSTSTYTQSEMRSNGCTSTSYTASCIQESLQTPAGDDIVTDEPARNNDDQQRLFILEREDLHLVVLRFGEKLLEVMKEDAGQEVHSGDGLFEHGEGTCL